MYRILSTALVTALMFALGPAAHAKKKENKQKQPAPVAVQHPNNGGAHPPAVKHSQGGVAYKAPKGGAHNHTPKGSVVYKAPKGGKPYQAGSYVTTGSQRSQVHGQNRHPQPVAAASYQTRNYDQRTYNQTSVNRTDVRNYQNYTQNRIYNERVYQPPVAVYRDWDRGDIHHWNNHRYHWYNNAWVIIDLPVGGSDSRSLEANVQGALAREGYDPGPIDGVVGGQTRDAIAAYQQDHASASPRPSTIPSSARSGCDSPELAHRPSGPPDSYQNAVSKASASLGRRENVQRRLERFGHATSSIATRDRHERRRPAASSVVLKYRPAHSP